MSDYYSNTYQLPRWKYMETVWFIRGYDRMKAEAEVLLVPDGISRDGQPHGTNTVDQTAEMAIRREKVLADIASIDQGIEMVPEEYRSVVFNNVARMIPLKDMVGSGYANKNTWSKWRGRFVLYVAQNRGWTGENNPANWQRSMETEEVEE